MDSDTEEEVDWLFMINDKYRFNDYIDTHATCSMTCNCYFSRVP